jgi:hypothetical protein
MDALKINEISSLTVDLELETLNLELGILNLKL